MWYPGTKVQKLNRTAVSEMTTNQRRGPKSQLGEEYRKIRETKKCFHIICCIPFCDKSPPNPPNLKPCFGDNICFVFASLKTFAKIKEIHSRD